jgi:LPS-assembly protein
MKKPRIVKPARFAGTTALACLLALGAVTAPALSQGASDIGGQFADRIPDNEQMLLEADTLVYDRDRNTVSAVGGVKILYGGNRLFAQRVTYDRNSSRLIASGNVEIIEKGGNRIFAQEVDITEDFGNGFVNALRVESADETYFAAESAERQGGKVTTFNNGVYTACEPCEEKPDKAPIWRVKARTIIWNNEKKTVRFENARFEFFGFPIAYLPFFEIADPTVKRKSGFLIPSITHDTYLGYGLKVPYYFALSPTYDLTVAGTYYTTQGFLGEAEWRQRFNSGQYSLKIAGISQMDPSEFPTTRVGYGEHFRGMVGTKGEFKINPRWTFGWNVMVQTDKDFSKRYDIQGYTDNVHRSELYLTGLNDRNYFDVRAMRFQVQEAYLKGDVNARAEEQPLAATLDYSYTPDEPVFGGELNLDVNAQGISRSELGPDPSTIVLGSNIPGLEGNSARLTAEAEWKRSFVAPGGLVLTPLLAVRGDGIGANYTDASIAAITTTGIASDIRAAYFRYMVTAGLEARWPVLFSTTSATHVLEPMAQIFARPDEQYTNSADIANEDAQSFVFDASTLFDRDKFSGYDRIEGGTRANLGIRYSGVLDNGWAFNALAGQSFQVAGLNSFATTDLVDVGAYSGLESDVSDYVGLVGFTAPFGLSASLGGRFDEKTFALRRTDVTAAYSAPSGRVTLSGKYAFIEAQPDYGFPDDRHEVTGSASIKVVDNWRTFGSATWDFESRTLVSNSIGFAYDDECFTYEMAMTDSRDRTTKDRTRSFSFMVKLRTLGEFGTGSNSVSGLTGS